MATPKTPATPQSSAKPAGGKPKTTPKSKGKGAGKK